MRKFWTEEEISFLQENYPNKGSAFCEEKLKRTNRAVRDKARKLGITSNKSRLADSNLLKSGKYSEILKDTEYEALESYVSSKTPILHKHKICGYIWKTTPDNIKAIVGCPNCSSSRNIKDRKTYLYFIYFERLNLYKIGVTVDWDRRKNEFGETPLLITLEEFSTGKDAYKAEKTLKEKIFKHLYNSGILLAGNTETFLWPSK